MDNRQQLDTTDRVTATAWWLSKIANICKLCVRMGFAWSAVGVVIGTNTARIQGCDTFGLVCHVIAWTIIMGMMGAVLGLLGGKVRFVFLAAVCGLLIGLQADWTLGYAWPHAQANNGLLMGAIVGTTIGPWLKMYIHAAKMIRAALTFVIARPATESEST